LGECREYEKATLLVPGVLVVAAEGGGNKNGSRPGIIKGIIPPRMHQKRSYPSILLQLERLSGSIFVDN
jgi:hypothetical protein